MVRVLGARIIPPTKCSIEVEMLDNGLWKLEYEAVYVRPQDMQYDVFESAILITKRVAEEALKRAVNHDVKIEYGEDMAKVYMMVVDTLDRISSFIVGEYIAYSRLGNIKLRDLIALAALPELTELLRKITGEKENE